MATTFLTGKPGSSSSAPPVPLTPSRSVSPLIARPGAKPGTRTLGGPKPHAASGCQSWRCRTRALQRPHRTPQLPGSTRHLPGSSTGTGTAVSLPPPGSCPGSRLRLGPGMRRRDSPGTTCPSSLPTPSVSGQPFHILSRKDFRTAAKTHFFLCFCLMLSPQGHAGWQEMGTYHRAKARSRDVRAIACAGWFERRTECILGCNSDFSRQIRHTRTHINYRFWALIHEDRCRNHKFTAASRVLRWQASTSTYSSPRDTRPSVPKQKEPSSTKKQTFTYKCCSELHSESNAAGPITNPSSGLLCSLHLLHIFILSQK